MTIPKSRQTTVNAYSVYVCDICICTYLYMYLCGCVCMGMYLLAMKLEWDVMISQIVITNTLMLNILVNDSQKSSNIEQL